MSERMVKLSDIAEVRLGRQRSPKNHIGTNMRKYLRAANVSWDGLKLDDVKSMNFEAKEMELYRLQRGDILLSEASGSPTEVGKPAIWNGEIPDCAFQNTLIRVRPHAVEPRYLLHYFQHQAREGEFARGSRGVGISHLGHATLACWQVPLPTIGEQQRIVGVLDRAVRLRTARRRTTALLDKLTQSTFAGMFGNIAMNTHDWPTSELGEAATFFGGASLPEGDPYFGQVGGYFLLKVSDMTRPGNSEFIRDCSAWTPDAGQRSATCPSGTIIIPKRGAAISTNKKRITERQAVLDPNLMGILPRPGLLELTYLYHWFLQFDLLAITSGSSVPQLNKKDLAPLKIQTPPLALQREFARRISKVQTVRESCRAHLVELDALLASLQYRAFRGELFDSSAA